MYFEYLLPHNKVTNIPVKPYNFKKTPKQKFPYIFSQYFFGQTFPAENFFPQIKNLVFSRRRRKL